MPQLCVFTLVCLRHEFVFTCQDKEKRMAYAPFFCFFFDRWEPLKITQKQHFSTKKCLTRWWAMTSSFTVFWNAKPKYVMFNVVGKTVCWKFQTFFCVHFQVWSFVILEKLSKKEKKIVFFYVKTDFFIRIEKKKIHLNVET